MKITERILLLLEYRGIKKYQFHKDLGLSRGFLDKPRDITTDKYAKILSFFPDVNESWLLTGKGNMLKETTEKQNEVIEPNKNDLKEKTEHTIADRILLLLNSKGITKNQFDNDMGIHRGYLYTVRELPKDMLDKVFNYFPEVNKSWLLTGEGNMLKGTTAIIDELENITFNNLSASFKLKLIRHKLGLTQEDFAARLNLKRFEYNPIETGKASLSFPLIIDICNKYNVNLNFLFFGKEPIFVANPDVINDKGVSLKKNTTDTTDEVEFLKGKIKNLEEHLELSKNSYEEMRTIAEYSQGLVESLEVEIQTLKSQIKKQEIT